MTGEKTTFIKTNRLINLLPHGTNFYHWSMVVSSFWVKCPSSSRANHEDFQCVYWFGRSALIKIKDNALKYWHIYIVRCSNLSFDHDYALVYRWISAVFIICFQTKTMIGAPVTFAQCGKYQYNPAKEYCSNVHTSATSICRFPNTEPKCALANYSEYFFWFIKKYEIVLEGCQNTILWNNKSIHTIRTINVYKCCRYKLI